MSDENIIFQQPEHSSILQVQATVQSITEEAISEVYFQTFSLFIVNIQFVIVSQLTKDGNIFAIYLCNLSPFRCNLLHPILIQHYRF